MKIFPRAKEINKRIERVFDFLASLDPKAISDTIFSRQPLFFSLFMALDSIESLSKKRIEEALFDMDSRFLDESHQTQNDLDFVKASSATTQRITQRKIRDKYIKGFIK